MKRLILLVLMAISITAASVYLKPYGKGSCDLTSMCPTHGVDAQFTGQTKVGNMGCVYGQYRHGNCVHWDKCFCPGE
jgi:hypothetical protein